MGLFTFIGDAGAKLFGGKTSAEKAAESEAEKASKIAELVHGLDLGVKDFTVSVDGDKATISGEAPNQEVREKVILATGNVAGIAKVEDNITLEGDGSADDEADFYTVKSGDSLSKISKEFYGDPMKYNQIFEANKPMLSDPDKIYPGQTLRIPKQ